MRIYVREPRNPADMNGETDREAGDGQCAGRIVLTGIHIAF